MHVHICHIWRPKIRGQFLENFVLWIYEFLFNSDHRIAKEEKIMEILRIQNSKYDRNFQFANFLFYKHSSFCSY